jgi:phosphopantothenoylcysteine decarboxylase/phosphopantothenate--cysteine ligase
MLANDVAPASGVMGGDRNTVHLLTRRGAEVAVDSWPVMTKDEVAAQLIARIADAVAADAVEKGS